jgi:GPH family glycoside/pentoside/hexuronide:cation symporter
MLRLRPSPAKRAPFRVPLTTKLGYGSFRFGEAMAMQTMTVAVLFYSTAYMIPVLWFALAQPVLKIIDTITDPLIGYISDRTRTRWGRRRPFILGGAIAMALVYVLLWSPQLTLFYWVETPSTSLVFAYYVGFYLLYYLTHTSCAIPYNALGAELSSDYNERTKIFQIRHLIGLPAVPLGTVAYLVATNPRFFESEKLGMPIATGVFAIILVVAAVVTVIVATPPAQQPRETPRPENQPRISKRKTIKVIFSNRSFLFLCLAIFFLYMGFLFTIEFSAFRLTFEVFGGDKHAYANLNLQFTVILVVMAMLANLLVLKIATLVGKRAALIGFTATSLLIPLASLFAFNPDAPHLYFFMAVGLALGMSGIEILSMAMIGDICDLDELENGERREGIYAGILNGAQKAGVVLSPTLAMVSLHLCGFDETLKQQRPETLERFEVAMALVAGVVFMAAILCAIAIKIRKTEVEAAQAELERRRVLILVNDTTDLEIL